MQREQGDRPSILHAAVIENVAVLRNSLYVFYDIETTQDIRYTHTARVHVPNLVSLQQFCARGDSYDDTNIICDRGGKSKHSFWLDPVGEMLSYLCEQRPWIDKVVAMAHNAKAFDQHFTLNKAILQK
jgi:hypothetical protein